MSRKVAFVVFPLFIMLSAYLIFFCFERISIFNKMKEIDFVTKYRENKNDYFISDSNTNLITDMQFIEEQQNCPISYEEILPYPLCDSGDAREHLLNQINNVDQNQNCYNSKDLMEQILLKRSYTNQERQIKLKICQKLVKVSEYKYFQIQSNVADYFQKICVYSDTPKRGYLSNKNECASISLDQKCQINEMKYESQFMIYCLDKSNNELFYGELNRLICKEDEIACTTFQTLYCLQNTDKCPIVDIEVNDLFLQFKDESISVESNNFQFESRRDNLLKARIIGLEIKENDHFLNSDAILQNINVRKINSLKMNSQQKEKVLVKIEQRFERNKLYGVDINEFQNSIIEISQHNRAYYSLFLTTEIICTLIILLSLRYSWYNGFITSGYFKFLLIISTFIYHLTWLIWNQSLIQFTKNHLDYFDHETYVQIFSFQLQDYILMGQLIFYLFLLKSQ